MTDPIYLKILSQLDSSMDGLVKTIYFQNFDFSTLVEIDETVFQKILEQTVKYPSSRNLASVKIAQSIICGILKNIDREVLKPYRTHLVAVMTNTIRRLNRLYRKDYGQPLNEVIDYLDQLITNLCRNSLGEDVHLLLVLRMGLSYACKFGVNSPDYAFVRVLLRILIPHVQSAPRNTKIKLFHLLKEEVKELIFIFKNCGDFQLQYAIIELLFHIKRNHQKRYLHIWFPESKYQDFRSAYDFKFGVDDFDSFIRHILNEFNNVEKMIFSIPCVSVKLADIEMIQPFKDLEYWIDFNFGTNCVHIMCNHSSFRYHDGSWTFLTISNKNVRHANIEKWAYAPQLYGKKLKIILKNGVEMARSGHIDSKYAQSNVVTIFFDPSEALEKLEKFVLPRIFSASLTDGTSGLKQNSWFMMIDVLNNQDRESELQSQASQETYTEYSENIAKLEIENCKKNVSSNIFPSNKSTSSGSWTSIRSKQKYPINTSDYYKVISTIAGIMNVYPNSVLGVNKPQPEDFSIGSESDIFNTSAVSDEEMVNSLNDDEFVSASELNETGRSNKDVTRRIVKISDINMSLNYNLDRSIEAVFNEQLEELILSQDLDQELTDQDEISMIDSKVIEKSATSSELFDNSLQEVMGTDPQMIEPENAVVPVEQNFQGNSPNPIITKATQWEQISSGNKPQSHENRSRTELIEPENKKPTDARLNKYLTLKASFQKISKDKPPVVDVINKEFGAPTEKEAIANNEPMLPETDAPEVYQNDINQVIDPVVASIENTLSKNPPNVSCDRELISPPSPNKNTNSLNDFCDISVVEATQPEDLQVASKIVLNISQQMAQIHGSDDRTDTRLISQYCESIVASERELTPPPRVSEIVTQLDDSYSDFLEEPTQPELFGNDNSLPMAQVPNTLASNLNEEIVEMNKNIKLTQSKRDDFTQIYKISRFKFSDASPKSSPSPKSTPSPVRSVARASPSDSSNHDIIENQATHQSPNVDFSDDDFMIEEAFPPNKINTQAQEPYGSGDSSLAPLHQRRATKLREEPEKLNENTKLSKDRTRGSGRYLKSVAQFENEEIPQQKSNKIVPLKDSEGFIDEIQANKVTLQAESSGSDSALQMAQVHKSKASNFNEKNQELIKTTEPSSYDPGQAITSFNDSGNTSVEAFELNKVTPHSSGSDSPLQIAEDNKPEVSNRAEPRTVNEYTTLLIDTVARTSMDDPTGDIMEEKGTRDISNTVKLHLFESPGKISGQICESKRQLEQNLSVISSLDDSEGDLMIEDATKLSTVQIVETQKSGESKLIVENEESGGNTESSTNLSQLKIYRVSKIKSYNPSGSESSLLSDESCEIEAEAIQPKIVAEITKTKNIDQAEDSEPMAHSQNGFNSSDFEEVISGNDTLLERVEIHQPVPLILSEDQSDKNKIEVSKPSVSVNDFSNLEFTPPILSSYGNLEKECGNHIGVEELSLTEISSQIDISQTQLFNQISGPAVEKKNSLREPENILANTQLVQNEDVLMEISNSQTDPVEGENKITIRSPLKRNYLIPSNSKENIFKKPRQVITVPNLPKHIDKEKKFKNFIGRQKTISHKMPLTSSPSPSKRSDWDSDDDLPLLKRVRSGTETQSSTTCSQKRWNTFTASNQKKIYTPSKRPKMLSKRSLFNLSISDTILSSQTSSDGDDNTKIASITHSSYLDDILDKYEKRIFASKAYENTIADKTYLRDLPLNEKVSYSYRSSIPPKPRVLSPIQKPKNPEDVYDPWTIQDSKSVTGRYGMKKPTHYYPKIIAIIDLTKEDNQSSESETVELKKVVSEKNKLNKKEKKAKFANEKQINPEKNPVKNLLKVNEKQINSEKSKNAAKNRAPLQDFDVITVASDIPARRQGRYEPVIQCMPQKSKSIIRSDSETSIEVLNVNEKQRNPEKSKTVVKNRAPLQDLDAITLASDIPVQPRRRYEPVIQCIPQKSIIRSDSETSINNISTHVALVHSVPKL